MVDFKRGISGKDLRPFSVEDPLGQRREREPAVHSKPRRSVPHQPAAFDPATSSSDGVPTPARGARMAQLGCLLVIVVWAMGLVGSAAAWLPQLLTKVRPTIERLVAEWEQARAESGSAPSPGAAPPSPASTPSQPSADADATPEEPPSSSVPPSGTGEPSADPAQAELLRVCERTVACCLTVQGERARSICENFRRMPTVAPCEESYKVFAQVGRQLGRACE